MSRPLSKGLSIFTNVRLSKDITLSINKDITLSINKDITLSINKEITYTFFEADFPSKAQLKEGFSNI